ncbi:MAG: ACT domain-containing protein, partial [Novosphingobium sp.]
LASFREDEGLSQILPFDAAHEAGYDVSLPMSRIVLEVHSALEGAGLTAAVSRALDRAGIACNMVAAYHHDHVFVPQGDADRALGVLKRLQGSGA